MKKTAKRKSFHKSKVKGKNSLLLLAVLVIAVVGIVVWGVIAISPGKTPNAMTPIAPPSLTVNWNTPAGNASFVDVGNKKANCQSTSNTCSTGQYVYWPGSKVNYVVRVSSISGPVLQNGSTTATQDGRAVANWSMRYEVNAFPDSLGSCGAAGDKCVKSPIVTGNNFTATNLQPSTIYRLIVCAPACVGGVIIQNTTAKTPDVIIGTPMPTVTPKAGVACGLGSSTVVAGNNLGFGYNGFATGQKIFVWDGGVNRIDLGTTLAGSQLVSFKIPSTAPAGKYGGFIENKPYASVVCGSVTITSASGGTAACVYSPTTIVVGNSLGIIPNNFPPINLNVKIAGRVFGNIVNLGTIPPTGGGVLIPTSVPAPQQYDVLVNSGAGAADIKCTGILTVNPKV